MTNPANIRAGCLLVGEYVDEAVRPQVVGNHVDIWASDDNYKEFIVLLKDGREVAVRGQGLKHLPASVSGESGSYGVIVRSGGEEVLIALFKVFEVIGIFHGEMRSERKIA